MSGSLQPLDRAAQRANVITNAGARFDSGGSSLHTLTSRRAFVNDSLRQAGLPLLADAEADGSLDSAERQAVIANAAGQYDGEPGLKNLTGRTTFIDGALRQNKMVLLTAAELDRHS